MHVPEQVLKHKAADTRASIDNREDEERLKHDGEVIPETEEPVT